MLFAIGKTATLRKGVFVPGGQRFEVSSAEVEDLRLRGYEIISEADSEGQETDGINILPEKETTNIPEIYPGENSDSEDSFEDVGPKMLSGVTSEVTTPMGSASRKVKATSKVSSKKEG